MTFTITQYLCPPVNGTAVPSLNDIHAPAAMGTLSNETCSWSNALALGCPAVSSRSSTMTLPAVPRERDNCTCISVAVWSPTGTKAWAVVISLSIYKCWLSRTCVLSDDLASAATNRPRQGK